MKLIYSLLILSLIVVAGCKRPERSTDAPTVDPVATSSHSIETAPLQNSHLATTEFTSIDEPEEPEEATEPEEPEEPDDGDLTLPE